MCLMGMGLTQNGAKLSFWMLYDLIPPLFFLSYIMSRVHRLAWEGNLHLLLGACNCHCCFLFAHVVSAESG